MSEIPKFKLYKHDGEERDEAEERLRAVRAALHMIYQSAPGQPGATLTYHLDNLSSYADCIQSALDPASRRHS